LEIKRIKDLMAAMTRHGMKKLAIVEDGFEIRLERETQSTHTYAEPPTYHIEPPRQQRSDIPTSLNSLMPHKEEVSGTFVTSPMVGTFYRTPAPDEPDFVKVGDVVEADSVVCIIEAMKVMNEVKAGVSGKVAEILIDNGHPVEFGTKLYRIT
jgi:acetyl-CoA carboxylase biotin carboxyl carrier protein